MEFEEARKVLADYTLENRDIPKEVRDAIESMIMIANSKNTYIVGDNPLSNKSFYDSVVPTFRKLDAGEKLNYFRNLFYKESDQTIEYMIAWAINDFVTPLTKKYNESKELIDKALSLAFQYGQIDGNHHKMWVIDQMVKALIGNENDYKLWVQDYSYDSETGEEYTWDTGIAP